MRMSLAVETELRRVIRDARAKDALISTDNIRKILEEKYQRGFSYQYVAKLVEKVAREAIVEVDRAKIEQRLAFTRENARMARERLLQIIYWKLPEDVSDVRLIRPPLNKDVVEACKNLVMLDLAVLSAEVAAGMYRSEEEAAAKLRYAPMLPERRQVVINMFVNWGALPREQVEALVPALPHGDPESIAA